MQEKESNLLKKKFKTSVFEKVLNILCNSKQSDNEIQQSIENTFGDQIDSEWIELASALFIMVKEKSRIKKKEKNITENALFNIRRYIRSNMRKMMVDGSSKPLKYDAKLWLQLSKLYDDVMLAATQEDFECSLICELATWLLASMIDVHVVTNIPETTKPTFDIKEKLETFDNHFPLRSVDVLLQCETLMQPQYRKAEAFLPSFRYFLSVFTNRRLELEQFLKVMLMAKQLLMISSNESKGKAAEFKMMHQYCLRNFAVPSNFSAWAESQLQWGSSKNLSIKEIVKKIKCPVIHEDTAARSSVEDQSAVKKLEAKQTTPEKELKKNKSKKTENKVKVEGDESKIEAMEMENKFNLTNSADRDTKHRKSDIKTKQKGRKAQINKDIKSQIKEELVDCPVEETQTKCWTVVPVASSSMTLRNEPKYDGWTVTKVKPNCSGWAVSREEPNYNGWTVTKEPKSESVKENLDTLGSKGCKSNTKSEPDLMAKGLTKNAQRIGQINIGVKKRNSEMLEETDVEEKVSAEKLNVNDQSNFHWKKMKTTIGTQVGGLGKDRRGANLKNGIGSQVGGLGKDTCGANWQTKRRDETIKGVLFSFQERALKTDTERSSAAEADNATKQKSVNPVKKRLNLGALVKFYKHYTNDKNASLKQTAKDAEPFTEPLQRKETKTNTGNTMDVKKYVREPAGAALPPEQQIGEALTKRLGKNGCAVNEWGDGENIETLDKVKNRRETKDRKTKITKLKKLGAAAEKAERKNVETTEAYKMNGVEKASSSSMKEGEVVSSEKIAKKRRVSETDKGGAKVAGEEKEQIPSENRKGKKRKLSKNEGCAMKKEKREINKQNVSKHKNVNLEEGNDGNEEMKQDVPGKKTKSTSFLIRMGRKSSSKVESSDEEESISKEEKIPKKRLRRKKKDSIKDQTNAEESSNGKVLMPKTTSFQVPKPKIQTVSEDSDLEILEVATGNVDRKQGAYSEVDEASGSDGDIVPCDELNKMFTEQETEDYHRYLKKEQEEETIKMTRKEMKHIIAIEQSISATDTAKLNQEGSETSIMAAGQVNKIGEDDLIKSLYHIGKDSSREASLLSLENKLKTSHSSAAGSPQYDQDSDPSYDDDDDDSEDLDIIFSTIKKDTKNMKFVKRKIKKEVVEDDIVVVQPQPLKCKPKPRPTSQSSEDFVSRIFNLYKPKPDEEEEGNYGINVIYDKLQHTREIAEMILELEILKSLSEDESSTPKESRNMRKNAPAAEGSSGFEQRSGSSSKNSSAKKETSKINLNGGKQRMLSEAKSAKREQPPREDATSDVKQTSKATSQDVNLSKATFHDMDLSKATSQDVDLSKATFQNMDLSKVTSHDVGFSKATFQDMNLSKATSQDVDLGKATSQDVDLSKAASQDMELSKAMPQDVDLSKATFQDVDLNKATSQDVDLGKATSQDMDLSKTMSQDVDLSKAMFQDMDLNKAMSKDVDFNKATFQDIDLSKAMSEDVDCSKAMYQAGDIRKTISQDVALEIILRNSDPKLLSTFTPEPKYICRSTELRHIRKMEVLESESVPNIMDCNTDNTENNFSVVEEKDNSANKKVTEENIGKLSTVPEVCPHKDIAEKSETANPESKILNTDNASILASSSENCNKTTKDHHLNRDRKSGRSETFFQPCLLNSDEESLDSCRLFMKPCVVDDLNNEDTEDLCVNDFQCSKEASEIDKQSESAGNAVDKPTKVHMFSSGSLSNGGSVEDVDSPEATRKNSSSKDFICSGRISSDCSFTGFDTFSKKMPTTSTEKSNDKNGRIPSREEEVKTSGAGKRNSGGALKSTRAAAQDTMNKSFMINQSCESDDDSVYESMNLIFDASSAEEVDVQQKGAASKFSPHCTSYKKVLDFDSPKESPKASRKELEPLEKNVNTPNTSKRSHGASDDNSSKKEEGNKSFVVGRVENIFENKENIVDNKQGEEIEVLSGTVHTDFEDDLPFPGNTRSMCDLEAKLSLKLPFKEGLVIYTSPKKSPGGIRKRNSLESSASKLKVCELTPLKVADAALATEVIISPDISDEENASQNTVGQVEDIVMPMPPVEKDSQRRNLNESTLEEEQICEDDLHDVSPPTVAPAASRKAGRKSLDKPLHKQSIAADGMASHKVSPKVLRSSKSKTTSDDFLLIKHSSGLPSLSSPGGDKVRQSVLASLSSPEGDKVRQCSPKSNGSSSVIPRKSPRLNSSIASGSSSSGNDHNSQTNYKAQNILEITEDVSEETESENRDTLSSPVKRPLMLKRLGLSTSPDMALLASPRRRRNSVSSVISENDDEVKCLESPSRPTKSRRSSLIGNLTPVRRSRRLSGLKEEPCQK